MVLISNHSYCSAGTGKGFFLSIVVPHGGVCAKIVLVLLRLAQLMRFNDCVFNGNLAWLYFVGSDK